MGPYFETSLYRGLFGVSEPWPVSIKEKQSGRTRGPVDLCTASWLQWDQPP